MKKILIGLSLVLFISGCSLTEPIPVRGEVVSCADIPIGLESDLSLECLGGGEPVSVEAIKGPAIINIWGTWCAPCREELPHLAHFLTKYQEQVQVIGIAVEEKSQAKVRTFIEKNGISWPILYDADGSTRKKFGMGVPVSWLIDKDGKVVYKKFGPFKSTEEIELAAIKYLGVK